MVKKVLISSSYSLQKNEHLCFEENDYREKDKQQSWNSFFGQVVLLQTKPIYFRSTTFTGLES